MNTKQFIFLILIIFQNKSINELNFKFSVVMPCHYKHFYLLEKMLDAYNNQTVLPDELIISISEYDKLDQDYLNYVINKIYKFPVKYILNKEVIYAGGNRNLASKKAIGDVIIYNDVDDFPLMNRVEVIKYFFTKFDIDHLVHEYNFDSDSIIKLSKRIPLEKLLNIDLNEDYKKRFLFLDEYKMIWNHRFHNGNIAIKKTIFKKNKWLNTMPDKDVEYNTRIFNKDRTIFVKYPLVVYSNTLSVSVF